MTYGTLTATAASRLRVTWTDPIRLFRTRLFLEPYDPFRQPAPFSEEALPHAAGAS